MDWQNQYCENVYTTESSLYIQCKTYQNSRDILHRSRKLNPKVHMEAQTTLNSQSNPEQKRAMLFKLHYRAIVAKPA
jgi:hypothetical protein